MNHRLIRSLVVVWGMVVLYTGCAAPHFFTVTIYESPDRVVKLQDIPDANNGKGFSHPAYIDQEKLEAVMRRGPSRTRCTCVSKSSPSARAAR